MFSEESRPAVFINDHCVGVSIPLRGVKAKRFTLVFVIPPVSPVADPCRPADVFACDGGRVVETQDDHGTLNFAKEIGVGGRG